MIKSFVINNIEDEYTPENILFEQWLSAFDFVKNAEITIKIVTPKEMKSLNILYRNQEKITDTLAFPFDSLSVDNKVILGDIAMCAKKINSDSILFKKNKEDRWAHLIVHSTLHLLGYTHDDIKNQKSMENKEIDILKKFNILNPYEI
tara:strand:- start:4960 stop:5403 length:444 start_codon:yes stop_codon:yes gene_type:complete